MSFYQITFALYNFGYNLKNAIEFSFNDLFSLNMSDINIKIDNLTANIPIINHESIVFAYANISFFTDESDTFEIVNMVYEILDPIMQIIGFFQRARINLFNYVIIKGTNEEVEQRIKGLLTLRKFNKEPREKEFIVQHKNLKRMVELSFKTILSYTPDYKNSILRAISLILESYETRVYEIKLLLLWSALEQLVNRISVQKTFNDTFTKDFHTDLKDFIFKKLKEDETISQKLLVDFEDINQRNGQQLSLSDKYVLDIYESQKIQTPEKAYSQIESYLKNKLNNEEPIKNRMKFLIKKLGIEFCETTENTLKYAHRMRNNIMHSGQSEKPNKIHQHPLKAVKDYNILVNEVIFKILQGVDIN